jgi:hypothetical protein
VDTGTNFGVNGTPCKAGINPALKLTNDNMRTGSESSKANITVYWRSDNVGVNGLVYKMMSVREISPTEATSIDITPAMLSNVTSGGTGTNSVALSWTTNEPSNTQVEYGPTTSYGRLSILNSSLVTNHNVDIVGLTPNTLYHYRGISTDASGNLAKTTDQTFKTAGACNASSGLWDNQGIAANTSSFATEFTATPSGSTIDGVIGLSTAAASDFSNLAAIVRFNTNGQIDARNGSVYTAITSIPYTANTAYRFRLVVNTVTHKYRAYVRSGGSAYQLIGQDFAFRSEQSKATSLSNLGILAGIGNVSVCDIATSAK